MPLDPRWIAAPPEMVALIFEAGPGPESMVAYGTVMATEAASHHTSMAASATNIANTSTQWAGLAGAANVARGTALHVGGLEPLATHCAKHVLLAQATVDAYTMARPSVIPSLACNANRDLWGLLNGTNWFGQNTPGIVATDIEYFGHFWTQNSSVGTLYATTLAAVAAAASDPSLLVSSAASPMTTGMGSAVSLVSQTAQTAGTDAAQAPAQGAQLAGSAGSTTSGTADQMTSMLSSAPQMMMGAVQPLTQAPTQLAQSGMQPMSQLMGMFMGANSPVAAETAGLGALGGAPLGGAGGAAAGGMGAGGGGIGGLGSSAASLTSFTQPASTFEPESGGRPTGKAGVLNAADLRGSPTARAGGSAMPMSPAGMLGRGETPSGKDKDDVSHARIVVDSGKQDLPRTDV
ncbi:MAG: PPE domain-containing protein [Mycobacterium sp.]